MLLNATQMFEKRRILGELLCQTRKQRGLTLRDAAKHLGKSYTWVSNTEKAQRNLNVVELWIICKAYEIGFTELVEQVMSYPTSKEGSHAQS
jgi:transcriptional regulator with XRE-family HTH domain